MTRPRRKGSGIGHGISGARESAHAARADESGGSPSKPATAADRPAVWQGTVQPPTGGGASPGNSVSFVFNELRDVPSKPESTRDRAGLVGSTGSASVNWPWAGSERRLGGLGAAAVAFVVATSMSLAPVPGAADDVDEAHEVVSVGSLMPAGAARDMQPITVIEREEIELSGMRNLWDFLRGQSSRLPQLRPRPPLHPRQFPSRDSDRRQVDLRLDLRAGFSAGVGGGAHRGPLRQRRRRPWSPGHRRRHQHRSPGPLRRAPKSRSASSTRSGAEVRPNT